ncbi:hypothetical protein JW935_00565, partial [candidate division KSB1 bacterium]|nr:hypothetical protein [candidate division KSB1 bacterium]
MRSDIVELGVPQYAGGAFSKADAVFRRAVERVEDGNIKSAKSLAADAEILYRKCVIEAISSNIVPTAGRNLKQSKETPKALKRSGISGVDQIRRRLNDQDQLDPAELFIDNCTEINEILTTAGLERLVPLPSAMDPSEAVLISPEIPKVRIISPRADSTVAGTISILAEVSDDSSLADVVFYVDNVKQQFQPIKTKKTQATVTFIWQSSLVTDGKHRIGIKVYDIDGNTNVAAVDIYVKNVLSIAQPDLFVSAHSITRHQNGFVVELSVINKGSAAAEQVLVQDYITPFQPVMRTASLPVKATYYPVYEFTNKRWRCNIECQVSIAPGTTVNFTYAAVPVLMDSNSPSAVIGAPVRLYYQDGTGKKYNKEIQGGITKTSTGTALSTAVLSACQEADYLLVTHPQRLYNQYFSYSVDSLLSHMAQLAVYEQGILGFLEKNDAKHLRDLVKPGGSWAIRMSPQFIKPLGGYLLIVGETEIVPSWTVNIGSTSIRISDAPYSDVSGDEVPDLIVGRIIGDRISTLSKSLLTSIGVYESAGGYNYDRDTAVTISDPGVGPFKKTVQTASTTMKNNGWKTVREIHPQDEFIVTNFLRAVQANDRISSGDVTGDKWAEIIHAKAAADKIYILDYTGKLLNSFNCVFDAGDCLAVGNVSGDSKDEILVADASSDQVSIYNAGGTLLQSIKMTFDAGDAITACDVLGLGNDQIVHADDSKDYIYVVQVTGSGPLTGMSFICAFDQGDILAAGDVMDDSKEEIVVADISLSKIFVRRLDTQNWCSYEHKYPLEKEDRLAVGNVFGKSQHINLVKDQILVLDKSVPRIYMHRWQNNQWVGSGELRAYLNGNDAVAIGDVGDFENTIKEEIIIANGDSITVYDTDRNWVRRTQRKIKTDFKNTDLIYYQGHGNYNVWGSLLNSHHNPGNPEVMFPLDFNQHNPVVISTCCVSGNYEAGTWEYKNIAESFFASGAAVYIGATENSAI